MSGGKAATAPAFTIVHLSDLHLTADDRAPRSEARLFGHLRGMNQGYRRLLTDPAVRDADLLLVTGDVTDRGEPAAWEAFWRPLREASLVPRVRVIPGNHDLCHLGVRLTDYRVNVQRAAAGLAAGGQSTRFPWLERLAGGRIALIGLNSANLGNHSGATNAIGRLGFFQLEALARLLRAVRAVPLVIVALHHSPNIPANRTADVRRLGSMSAVERWGMELGQAERRALRLLCLVAGVRLVVHGHLHRFEDRRVNALHIVGAPASTEPDAGDGGGLPFVAYELGAAGRVRVRRRHVAAE